ncbi:MAG: GNAT family N-acetyltransferase [Candidatus Delongbacteria bacterium]|nr:GNAT family N-acetyltransferase [Candidatus Delongbacteria bacterium]
MSEGSLNIEHLDWDSHFFGFGVGRIYVQDYDIDKIGSAVNLAFGSGDELIYLIIPQEIDKRSIYGSQFVDNKVVFEKIIDPSGKTEDIIKTYESSTVSQELYDLAYESGKFSRFNTDKNLPAGSFEKLYGLWIENSVNKKIADKVFICELEGRILGMVTLKIENDKGVIGLIASTPESQGKGVGSKLLSHCENYLLSSGINKIEVATQGENSGACNFYKKNGYGISGSLNYYHLWNK